MDLGPRGFGSERESETERMADVGRGGLLMGPRWRWLDAMRWLRFQWRWEL